MIGRTISTKEVNENAEEKELVELAVSTAQIDGHGTITEENLNNALKEIFNNTDVVTSNSEGWAYEANKKYNIHLDGYVEDAGEVAKILPETYTECEYIASTGTQYIDTKILPKRETKVEIEFEVTDYVRWTTVFESVIAGNMNSRFYFMQGDDTNNKFKIAYGGKGFVDTIVADNAKHTVIFNQNGEFVLDDKSYSISNTDYVENNMSIFIFTKNNTVESDVLSNRCSVKVYSCKIYDGDELVCNLIPCLDNNSKPCMYDTITKQSFYNKGTGDDFSYKVK